MLFINKLFFLLPKIPCVFFTKLWISYIVGEIFFSKNQSMNCWGSRYNIFKPPSSTNQPQKIIAPYSIESTKL